MLEFVRILRWLAYQRNRIKQTAWVKYVGITSLLKGLFHNAVKIFFADHLK